MKYHLAEISKMLSPVFNENLNEYNFPGEYPMTAVDWYI